MYCPRCSQEQASEDLRFCSRCGFPLAHVASVVASGGVLPQMDASAKNILTRRNGLIFSLFWFIFFVFLLTPIFGGVVHADALALCAALLGMIGGSMLVLASFVLLKNEPRASRLTGKNAEPKFVKNSYQKPQAALPPEQSIPVSTYFPRVQENWRDTKDLVQPSVTEGTTKLLERDEG